MPTRYQQQQIGKGHIIGQPHGKRMTFKMINRQKRLLRSKSNRLGGHGTNHNPTDKARPTSTGDRIKIGKINTGIVHRLGHQTIKMFQMCACGNFRHDPAIGAMIVKLRQDPV